MSNDFRELKAIELKQVAGGQPIGTGGGRPLPGVGDPGVGDGNPFQVIGMGGRDWWLPYPIPGFGDPGPVLPIVKPEPGKP